MSGTMSLKLIIEEDEREREPLTDADFKASEILLDIFIENKRISLTCAKIVFDIFFRN